MIENSRNNFPNAVVTKQTFSLDSRYAYEESHPYYAEVIETQSGLVHIIRKGQAPQVQIKIIGRPDLDIRSAIKGDILIPSGGHELFTLTGELVVKDQHSLLLAPVMRDDKSEKYLRYILEGLTSDDCVESQKEIVGFSKCRFNFSDGLILQFHNYIGFIVDGEGEMAVHSAFSRNEGSEWDGIHKFRIQERNGMANFEATVSKLQLTNDTGVMDEFYLISGLDFVSRDLDYLQEMLGRHINDGRVDEDSARQVVNPYIKIEHIPNF